MHTTRLRKVGGSVMLAVPPVLLDALDLVADKQVGLDVVDGALVVKPLKPRYTLDELLDQSTPAEPPEGEDRAWLDDAPVGREEI